MIRISWLNEVAIPIADYFRVSVKRDFLFDWGLPVLFCIAGRALLTFACVAQIQELNASIVSFTAILVGFSVASLSIIVASSSKSIEEMKGRETKHVLLGRAVSLYHLTLINFVYLLYVEFFVVFLGIFHLLGQPVMSDSFARWSYTVVLLFFGHAIVLNLRNLCAFYFTFAK